MENSEQNNEETAIAKLEEDGVALNLRDLVASMRSVETETEGTDGGRPLLKVVKVTGEWVLGQSNTDIGVPAVFKGKRSKFVNYGERIRIDVLSFKQGWVCWKDGEPTSRMASVFEKDPGAGENQGENEDGTKTKWERQFTFDGVVLSGPCEGEEFTMKGNSKGFLAFAGALAKFIRAKAQTKSLYLFPVLYPSTEIYQHKTYGATAKPHLEVKKIAYWTNKAGDAEQIDTVVQAVEEASDDAQDVEYEAVEAEAEAVAAETPDEAPKTRRRRRAGSDVL